MKILLLAYAVSPYRGSEYNVAWNHISQMAKKHQVTVLYGSSGEHMGDDDDMQKFLQTERLDNVEWHHIVPSTLANALNYLNRKGCLNYSFYMAYRCWHQNAYNYCKKELDVEGFDIIHFLSPIGYREPGFLWKLGRPYIWGAIGGATSIDNRLLPALSKSGQFKLLLRKALNWFQLRYSNRVKNAIKTSNVLLTATSENQEIFQTIHHAQSIYIPENGTTGQYLGDSRSKENLNIINLIWIGTVEARKALQLLIDSFAHVKNPQAFKVHVLGDGPLKETLTDYAMAKGLDSVFVWHGHIPRPKVLEVIQNADLHVITSVSEGNPTTIWEVMQYGVPTMTIDHCGMRDTITRSSGIKIKVSDYDKVVKDFAMELNKIMENPCILSALIPGVKRDFYKYHWDNRVTFFDDAYKKAIENWNG